ncbi:MAG: hypothetical protein ACXWMI_08770 [Syntrophales bacterium]
MLKVLDDESAIKRYRRQFIRSFKPFIDEKIPVNLGHPGATVKAKVLWSDRLGIWMVNEKMSGSRYGHAFGAEKPGGSSHIPITCEINFPVKGIDRRMGGALAEDRDGRIVVVHRGRIGGGKKGVGKALFDDHYRGVWAIMEDGSAESMVALIGVLNSPRFVRQVSQFVRKVDRMKNIFSSRTSQVEMSFDELHFREELIGASYADPLTDPSSMCDHGLIVKDLYDALSRLGFKAGNDSERDLLIVNARKEITAVFEVTTAASIPSIQSAAARLLLANTELPHQPHLIIAVPEAVDETLQRRLKKLGVDVLPYNWKHDQAVFPALPVLVS